MPGTYITAPKKADGKIDIDLLLKDIAGQIADQSKPDPRVILFSAQRVDLHEINRLKQQIADIDLPLAIDFGDPGPLK